ncbi:MAG: FtsX-like permease family protein [Ignavibacteriae bacterium]|nr:FtsX-like permease family protein [Ignavibacteriota bacterium]NOG97924.1 FtsX-like permease family protein [Ignavibacteriota bacterium]
MARVCVMGVTVIKELFGETNPIGEQIRIGNISFEVIGIMRPRGTSPGGDMDNHIFIPLKTLMRRTVNIVYISGTKVNSNTISDLEIAEATITSILRERLKLTEDEPDDFTIQSQVDLIEAQKETGDTFTALTASIAGVSLIVGGIGILAVMLLSIRERTNEIGLRMAVGARRKDIRNQFIFESAFLSIGGGIIGILIGITVSLSIRFVLDWSIIISLTSVLISFGFSMIIGLFFGVYPAYRASLLDPIDALRSE